MEARVVDECSCGTAADMESASIVGETAPQRCKLAKQKSIADKSMKLQHGMTLIYLHVSTILPSVTIPHSV